MDDTLSECSTVPSSDMSETLSQVSECSRDCPPNAFPAFQVTFSVTVLLDEMATRANYAVDCAAALGHNAANLPQLRLPSPSFVLNDVVLESYDEAAVMLPACNRDGVMLWEQGGLIADSTGKPIWQIGEEILYKKNGHELSARLMSIFPISIIH